MSYQLTIEPIGETIEVEEGQKVLDACLRAGIYLPYACNHGLCATCKVQVLEGEVEHNEASDFALMDMERDEGKTLACCATLLEDTIIEADIDEEPDAEHLPIKDVTGRVARLEDLTPTIKGVWIELDGEGLQFQAGQYLNLQVPGVEGPRAFSLANSPSQPNMVELNIRKVEGGAATSYIHDELKVGDELTLTAPLGRFFLRKSSPLPMIFLAGGSGLSSPKSMIQELLEAGDTRQMTLVYGARNASEIYYDDLFRELEAKHDNFTYVPALSDPLEEDSWSGEVGFVHDVAMRHFDNKFSEHNAYICGPPIMVDACITALMKGRLFEKNIFTESFLTVADGESTGRRSALFKKF
ncbi:MAG TPA: 2Fe-2S iron-sulfur cluster binding domain-containing protein [Porticoccus sp.]|nr:2Fe-2S iron-sulfur cluster binding domain-containing protein [Porticoccus sp.]